MYNICRSNETDPINEYPPATPADQTLLPMTMLQLRLFGSIELCQNGSEVPVRRRQVRHVLAVLGLAGPTGISLDDLIDDLWPIQPPKAPRSAAQVAISRVRSLGSPFSDGDGGSDALVTSVDGSRYRLANDLCDTDFSRWQSIRREAWAHSEAGSPEAAAEGFTTARNIHEFAVLAPLPASRLVSFHQNECDAAIAVDLLGELDALLALGRRASCGRLLERALAAALSDRIAAAVVRGYGRLGDPEEAMRACIQHRGRKEAADREPSEDFLSAERQLLGIDPAPLDLGSEHRIQDQVVGRQVNPPDAVEPRTTSAPVVDRVHMPDENVSLTLFAVAILGEWAKTALLAQVLGEDPEELTHTLLELEDAGVIQLTKPQYTWCFRNGQQGDSARRAVPASRARQFHLTASQVLAEQGRATAAATHAVHALPLGGHQRARDLCETGAHQAVKHRDFGCAADLFGSISGFVESGPERDRWLVKRADSLEAAARHEEADALYDEIFDRATTGELETLALCALGGSGRSGQVGGQSRRRSRLGVAYRRLPATHAMADLVAAEYALELLNAGRALGEELRDRVAQISRSTTSPGRVLAMRIVSAVRQLYVGAGIDEAIELAELCLAAALRGDRLNAGPGLAVSIQIALTQGDFRHATEWIDELDNVGRSLGDSRSRWQAITFSAALAENERRLVDADRLVAKALAIGRQLGIRDAQATHQVHHLTRAYRLGGLGPFATVLGTVGSRFRFPVWDALFGIAHFEAGDVDNARQSFWSSRNRWQSSADFFRPACAALLCDLAVRLSLVNEVDECIDFLNTWRAREIFLGYGGGPIGPVSHFQRLMTKGTPGTSGR